MTIYILAMVACFAVALAIQDQNNRSLKRENERLRSEVSNRFKHSNRFDYL